MIRDNGSWYKKTIILLAIIAFVFGTVDYVSARAGSSGGSSSSGSSSSSGGSKSSGGGSSGKSSYGNSSSGSKSSYGNTSSGSKSSYGNTSSGSKSSYGNTATGTSSGSQQRAGSAPTSKYGNTAGAASGGGQSGKPSAYDQRLNTTVSKQQAKESLSKYEAGQGRYKAKDTTTNYTRYGSNPIVSRSRGYDQNTYAYRRDNFYTANNYQPPQYAFMGAPSFGMWDAMFLWFMLDHISDRNYSRMYYNHQNDPDFKKWRQEADKLSGENAELKAKLASLDKQVAELKGEPLDPTYMPPGMDADIALNKKVVDKANPVKKESHTLRWLLIIALIALAIYFIYKKRKNSVSGPKFSLD
ncbi:MAG: hypothetical protein HQL01_09650 [Nitrospirae bacterium]|nr:hypothetical protein [Nitrospirota bacterium]